MLRILIFLTTEYTEISELIITTEHAEISEWNQCRRPVGYQAIIQLAFAENGRMHMIIEHLTTGEEYAASVGYV